MSKNVDWATIPQIVAVGHFVMRWNKNNHDGRNPSDGVTGLTIPIPTQPDTNYAVFIQIYSRDGQGSDMFYDETDMIITRFTTNSFFVKGYKYGGSINFDEEYRDFTFFYMVVRELLAINSGGGTSNEKV